MVAGDLNGSVRDGRIGDLFGLGTVRVGALTSRTSEISIDEKKSQTHYESLVCKGSHEPLCRCIFDCVSYLGLYKILANCDEC